MAKYQIDWQCTLFRDLQIIIINTHKDKLLTNGLYSLKRQKYQAVCVPWFWKVHAAAISLEKADVSVCIVDASKAFDRVATENYLT